MFKTKLFKQKNLTTLVRKLSTIQNRMKSWQVHSYGEELQCTPARMPIITSPTDVLVKVEAASVNPIDTYMKDGYGRTLVKLFRFSRELELPMTLGRDFSGVVVDKGSNVGNDFNVGDKVCGVIPFYKNGSHAEYTIANKDHIIHQPSSLSHIEAASLPFTFLTAYSALWITGGLKNKNTKGTKILILGASGGVGTMAVQMLRAVNATVIGTCSSNAVPLVQSLGADYVFDYNHPDYIKNVESQGRYDIIMDCAQIGFDSIPSTWEYKTYITLNSPLLKNTDQYGFIGGFLVSGVTLMSPNIRNLFNGKCVKWAFFTPSSDGLKFMNKLVLNTQLSPMVHKVFKFDELPKAYEAIKTGHLRGKVLVDFLEDK